jgi:RNA polymerase sigma factor (sigma-70 family)
MMHPASVSTENRESSEQARAVLQEEDLLWRVYVDGDPSAREELILAKRDLVDRVVRRYARDGELRDDLFEEGVLGLIEAIDHFDWSRGSRFDPYARKWIHAAVRHSLRRLHCLIRLPDYLSRRIRSWRKTERELRATTGESPDPETLRTRLELSPRQARRVMHALEANRMGHRDLFACGADPVVADASSRPETAEETRRVLRAVAHLPREMRKIIVERYGMNDGGDSNSWRSLSRRLGLSRRKVRSLARKALRRLRDELRGDTLSTESRDE